MQGMVKFYNKEKGFGFVVDESNKDFYFNHSAIPYGYIPEAGDVVKFEVSDEKQEKDNPKLSKVEFVERSFKKPNRPYEYSDEGNFLTKEIIFPGTKHLHPYVRHQAGKIIMTLLCLGFGFLLLFLQLSMNYSPIITIFLLIVVFAVLGKLFVKTAKYKA